MYRLMCVLLAGVLVIAGCGSERTAAARSCSSSPAPATPAAVAGRPSANSDPGHQGPAGVGPTRTLDRGGADARGTDTVFGAGAPVLTSQGPGSVPGAEPEIVLPSILYLVAHQTYRLVYANFISGFDPSDVVVAESLTGSVDHGDFWEYTPPGAGSFTLSIAVKDGTGATVASASRPIVVLAPSAEQDRLRELSVGDSITRAGGYARFAVCIAGGRTVGTRTYDGGEVSEEGRGGWTLQAYTTRIAEPAGGDSPFLFPTGIDGHKYRGNTAFWRDVTVGNPHGYDFDGFQMMARGWQNGGPYLFDPNGYPSSPGAGDVVVDPTFTAGSQWREFDGAQWATMDPQPQVEFSFAKYVDRFAAAFADGKPTAISVMLGTVDFLSSLTDAGWSAYKARLDTLIDSIRDWNSNVPVILIGSPSAGPAEFWAKQKVSGGDFNQRMIDHSRRLYAAYDTAAGRANSVYVMSFLGVVSPDEMADYVHPKMPQGHDQMGPWLGGMLAHLAADGKI